MDQESFSMAPWASTFMRYSENIMNGSLYTCIVPLETPSDPAELAPQDLNLVY
jgi:hypothetical protein